METSSFRSSSELGVDYPLFSHQWPTNNPHVELSTESIASLIYGNFQHSFTQQQPILGFKRADEYPGPRPDRPPKQTKPTASWDSCRDGNMFVSDSDVRINPSSLGMVKPKQEETALWSPSYNAVNSACQNIESFGNQDYLIEPYRGTKKVTNRRISQTPKDHILAERKRRENISQRLIALSALVPGLKKMDKASVLGDAVKYLKQLQERIKTLEEKAKKKSTEKLVFVKKYEIDGESCCMEKNSSNLDTDQPVPEIQARICDKDVLIIINCEKTKGVLERAVAEIEKLSLSVVNSCVMAFGDSALNITLLAKKDNGFSLDMKEVVNKLGHALKIFM